MKTWPNYSSFIILLALFLGAGCATGRVEQYYEGPKRPSQEIARLVLPQEVDVLRVDGREVVEGVHLDALLLQFGRDHLAYALDGEGAGDG